MSSDFFTAERIAELRRQSEAMTEADWREQAINFAYHNGHIEDKRITREGVARAYDAATAVEKGLASWLST